MSLYHHFAWLSVDRISVSLFLRDGRCRRSISALKRSYKLPVTFFGKPHWVQVQNQSKFGFFLSTQVYTNGNSLFRSKIGLPKHSKGKGSYLKVSERKYAKVPSLHFVENELGPLLYRRAERSRHRFYRAVITPVRKAVGKTRISHALIRGGGSHALNAIEFCFDAPIPPGTDPLEAESSPLLHRLRQLGQVRLRDKNKLRKPGSGLRPWQRASKERYRRGKRIAMLTVSPGVEVTVYLKDVYSSDWHTVRVEFRFDADAIQALCKGARLGGNSFDTQADLTAIIRTLSAWTQERLATVFAPTADPGGDRPDQIRAWKDVLLGLNGEPGLPRISPQLAERLASKIVRRRYLVPISALHPDEQVRVRWMAVNCPWVTQISKKPSTYRFDLSALEDHKP